MRPVTGDLKLAYQEVRLDFEPVPNREQLESDAGDDNIYIKRRAEKFLRILDEGGAIPKAVDLPLSVVRIGDDLTFMNAAGEVVVDYSLRLKNLFGNDHPWLIGYAYEVPCYIPSVRILKEGGYEAEFSLIYYGFYGPFTTDVETTLVEALTSLVDQVR